MEILHSLPGCFQYNKIARNIGHDSILFAEGLGCSADLAIIS
jgi:hypothetical protein